MNSEAHCKFFEETLAMYQKSTNQVSFFSGDNCSVNRKIANIYNIPLVGCYSHRLNLAAKRHIKLSNMEDLLTRVNRIMVELSGIKKRAELRKYTDFCPIKLNLTRWTSSFEMIKRFFILNKYIDLEDELMMDLSLNSKEYKELENLFEELKIFNSVTIELQKDDLNLLDARILFDALIEKFPSSAHYLSLDANIVNNIDFERSVCAYFSGDLLTNENVKILENFKLDELLLEDGSLESSNFATIILSRKRSKKAAIYQLNHIPPTSNFVERFFSTSKIIMSSSRKSMLPRSLELILFLKFNKKFWDINSMAEL